MPALQLFLWGNQKFTFGKLKYLGWFVAALLLFRGAWGIGMSQSAYLRNAKISPLICHPFSEFRP
jgi:cytochrome b